MPNELYETLFALDATKVSTDGDVIRRQLHATIEKYGGELLVARPWDENGKLAYPIQKQKKAYFYIVYYRFESTKHDELAVDFRINENILRLMTSHVDPKWAETMLDIARNETNARFAHKGMTDDSAPTGEGIVSNDPMVRAAMGERGDRGDRGPDKDGPPPARGPRGPRAATAEKPE